MKAKLKKTEEGFYHIKFSNDEDMMSCALGLLSLKNCQAIEKGYDLDELLDNITPKDGTTGNISQRIGFVKGFQKALEILGDKKFSEEDVRNIFAKTLENAPSTESHTRMISDVEYRHSVMDELYDIITKSLQQTEWDVEIEMQCLDPNCDGINRKGECIPGDKPKLDADGYLILKRV